MANIVTYIEVRDGIPTLPSLYALAEARRIAASVGATVYGLLALPLFSNVKIDELAAEVSAAGADRVLCCSHATLDGPTLDVTHGQLLLQVAQRLLSPLFLLPSGQVALEIGPALSIRIGGTFMMGASVEITPGPASAVKLHRYRPDGCTRVIDVKEHERPVVASLGSGMHANPTGALYAEVEMIPYPTLPTTPFEILSSSHDPNESAETASHLIVVHPTLPIELRNRIAEIAKPSTLLLTEGAPGTGSIGRASPESIIWISPGRPWDPSADYPLALRPTSRAYFVGQNAIAPPTPFKVIQCDSTEALALILENQ
jgi:hypothetical protein